MFFNFHIKFVNVLSNLSNFIYIFIDIFKFMKKNLRCIIIVFGSIGKMHALNFYKSNCQIFIRSIKRKKSFRIL